MKTPLDHYAPHLDGIEKPCSFCAHETTFVVPHTTIRWCGQCGAIHLDSPFRCLPSTAGLDRVAPGVPEIIRDQGPDPMRRPICPALLEECPNNCDAAQYAECQEIAEES